MWFLLVSALLVLVRGIDYYDDSNEHIKLIKQKLKALDPKEEVVIENAIEEAINNNTVKVKEDPETKMLCMLNLGQEFCITIQKKQLRGVEIKEKLELVECVLKNIGVGWRSAAAVCWHARARRDYPLTFRIKPLTETIANVE